MAGTVTAGRNLLLKKASVVIAGVRVLGLKYSNTGIDISDADSKGLPEYLAGFSSEQSITLDVSGVHKDDTFWLLVSLPTSDKLLTDLTFTHPGMTAAKDVLAGNFLLTSYGTTGEHKGEVTFDATFTSSGAWAAT